MAQFTLMSRLHRVFYLTYTTHVNFMGSHILGAKIVPDLYYKLPDDGWKHSRNMSPCIK